MSLPRISAIVVTYQTGPRLKECLYALSSDEEVAEIVIVDNGNPPEMSAWLRAFAQDRSGVKLLSGQGNIGFGSAVNLGAGHAAGPGLLVINPDAVLRRSSLMGMHAVGASGPEPWIVGGKIFDLYGREERGARRKDLTLWRAATSVLGWNTWTLESTAGETEPVEMPVISGAFFLTNRASWDLLGGFDETYFMHVEDVDLCRTCRALGGRVYYDPRAAALHYGATSNAPAAAISAYKTDSLEHYFRKFARTPFERACVAIAIPVMRLAQRKKAR
ncbi:MAG: glycosyltransferase family 2 protein [Pseudomonadota bacterium]